LFRREMQPSHRRQRRGGRQVGNHKGHSAAAQSFFDRPQQIFGA
jgi:hypothetical protein